ncbi:MAG: chemotaxis protein [Burkholderiales bacterium 68-12]|nr:MAG: chemotaxis protein [Burkholderiales bacterium 68-12]
MFKGIAASVFASFLFAALYDLSPRLAPLGGEDIFGWRVLCSLPFTTALLFWRGEGAHLRALLQRVRARPVLALGLVLSSALFGVQLWLFMWAPLHGRALPVSLGYFLLPLTLVLTGRVLYREQLSPAHRAATALAALGVGWELLRAGGVSWETALVALGYPVYFALRRRLGTQQLAGHWLDLALLVPVALWFVLRAPSTLPVVLAHPPLWALVPLVGVVSSVALALYMAASRLLPLGLFGLLSYVEPVLLVGVALLLGENLAPGQGPLYGLVFAAVGLLVLDGGLRLRREWRRVKE